MRSFPFENKLCIYLQLGTLKAEFESTKQGIKIKDQGFVTNVFNNRV